MELKNVLPINGPSVEEAKKYIDKYNDELIVIKCGGSVLLDPNLFDIFIKDIAILKKIGLSPIIVHGGGPKIKKKLSELNIESTFIKGLRVTDDKIINIVEDVLVELNKEIVNALKNQSCKARRITTKENNVILVKPEIKELGFVGSPNKINKVIKIFKIFFSDRKIIIAKEMTKIYESFIRSDINSLEILRYNLKGELTVVISNKFNVKKKSLNQLSESVKNEIKLMLTKYSNKDVSDFISKREKISKKIIYDYCISLKK